MASIRGFLDNCRAALRGDITVKTWWACTGLTGTAFRKWFVERLQAKINRNDGRAWRKLDGDYQTRLYRDCQRVRDRVQRRIIVRQFETAEIRARFGHLLTTADDL